MEAAHILVWFLLSVGMNLPSEWDAVRSLENGASLWAHSSDTGQAVWVCCRQRWGNPGRRENRRNLGWLMVHVDIGLVFNAVSQNSTSSAFSCCLNSRSFQASLHIEMPSFIKECQHIRMTCLLLPAHLSLLPPVPECLFPNAAVGPESIFLLSCVPSHLLPVVSEEASLPVSIPAEHTGTLPSSMQHSYNLLFIYAPIPRAGIAAQW